jgi:hypothetical protein
MTFAQRRVSTLYDVRTTTCKYTLWRSHNDEIAYRRISQNVSPSISDAYLYTRQIIPSYKWINNRKDNINNEYSLLVPVDMLGARYVARYVARWLLTTPHLNLGARYRWVVRITTRPINPQARSLPMKQRTRWATEPIGPEFLEKKVNSCPCRDSNPVPTSL